MSVVIGLLHLLLNFLLKTLSIFKTFVYNIIEDVLCSHITSILPPLFKGVISHAHSNMVIYENI